MLVAALVICDVWASVAYRDLDTLELRIPEDATETPTTAQRSLRTEFEQGSRSFLSRIRLELPVGSIALFGCLDVGHRGDLLRHFPSRDGLVTVVVWEVMGLSRRRLDLNR